MTQRSNYFEDLPEGEVIELGSHTFTAEDIKRFAAKYDPQPFHLDEEKAKNSLFGALCASGWHTVSVMIGKNIRHRQMQEKQFRDKGEDVCHWGPSPGFRELKWPKPVFVGDTVTYKATRIEKRDLASRPERGLNIQRVEGFNQNGEQVLSVIVQILVPRRVPLEAKPA
jgi:acyl dehydratase